MQTQVLIETEIIVTDEQLMIELQQGSRSAFNELATKYHQDAIRLAYYYAGNWEDARDLSQDAFVKVFQQAHTFDPTQSFRPWFFRILVNHVLNHLKRKKRIHFFSIFDQSRNDNNNGSFAEQIPEQEPYKTESNFITNQLVWSALNQLSENHRSVLVLFEIEGLKEFEIADILKCSTGTVKSRLHYARKKMKKILEKEMR